VATCVERYDWYIVSLFQISIFLQNHGKKVNEAIVSLCGKSKIKKSGIDNNFPCLLI
jgi:hypothetical protein